MFDPGRSLLSNNRQKTPSLSELDDSEASEVEKIPTRHEATRTFNIAVKIDKITTKQIPYKNASPRP
jgi:hypothetical protein